MIRTRLHHLLEGAAAASPDAPALSYGGRSVSYAAAWRLARAAAAQLAEAGVRRGDRVAIYLEKRLETVAAIFGASIAGLVFVPVNHVLRAPQVGHILRDSGARVLVTSGERLAQLSEVLDDSAVETIILVGGGTAGAGSRSLLPWREDPITGPVSTETVDLDPAAILYTSGSTGRPKGVVLSHRNLIVGAESVSTYLGNTSEDVILSVLPLSFDAGLSQVTTAFAVGAHCVLMNYLLPREVPKLAERYGVTGLTCVPPLWSQLADVDWPEAARGRIRYWANTGGRMPKVTLDRLRALMPSASPFLMYGLTEAFRSTYLDPAEIDRRPDSIGKAIPNAEILVLRPDGSVCGPGEDGELVHRGALVALGYWNDAEKTAERFRLLERPDQPWRAPERAVWSGDTVRTDEEGFLYFVGRSDEMIKTSGYRVSPTEVEEAAFATGLIREAVALGIPDDRLGQRIVLIGAPAEVDAEALIASLRQQLPAYMVPSRVELRDALPRSANGKFDRTAMRAEVTA